ncbi:MAG: 50S ribosomal protein L25 [candidate division Zixibacteria bacterium]|nr:50S ribosomal protein L25 [candidate division Zixibacteria bacterium]
MKEVVIEAAARTKAGKGVARKLRASKMIPAVVYGKGEEPKPLEVDLEHFHQIYHELHGENALINLKIDGQKSEKKALIRDMQHDPVYGDLLHVDFQNISMDQNIRLSIPVHLSGTAQGVKTYSGILQWSIRELDVLSLPANLPDYINIAIDDLNIGDSIHVKDLDYPDIEFLKDKNETIVSVIAPTVVQVEAEEDEEGEEVEEAAPSTDEQAEPEVISEKKAEERKADKEKK